MRSHLLRLARNTAIYGIGQAALRAISLLLLPIFTAYLTPTDYGISSILGFFTFLVMPVFALGIASALGVVFFERDDEARKAATIWTALLIVSISAAALIAVGLPLADPLARLLFPKPEPGYDLGYLVSLTVLTAAMRIVGQPLVVHLQFRDRARTFVAITVGPAALSILLSLVFIVVLGRGIAGFIEAGAIAELAALVLALRFGLPARPIRLERPVSLELLRLGLVLVPGFLAVFAMQQANRYILQVEHGLDEVGIYTIGYNFGLLMTLFVSGFGSAWYPFFSAFMERRDEARALFGRIFTYYVLGFGSVSLLFFMAARPVILLMTQPPFHGAYVSVGPSALAQFLTGAYSILLAGMYFAKEVRFQVVVQGIAAAISVALNLLLIPRFGSAGAALALALGFLSMVLLQHWWNIRRDYLDIQYDGRRVISFALVYIAFALAFLWERELPLLAEVALSGVGAVALAGAVLLLTTSSERASIRRELRGRLTGAESQ